MIMGLSGALYVSFIGYVSPWDFLPILTFQIWTMLIVGGSANNRGALLGALIVWGVWTTSGFVISRVVPSEIQAQGGAMQAVLIGLILVAMLLIRPRGLIGEELHVSRHARP
jgi:branched-chain amino acid transport system permease protein